MSRRDYELIAKVLAQHYAEDKKLVASIAVDLGKALLEDNPRFNPVRFFKAITG